MPFLEWRLTLAERCWLRLILFTTNELFESKHLHRQTLKLTWGRLDLSYDQVTASHPEIVKVSLGACCTKTNQNAVQLKVDAVFKQRAPVTSVSRGNFGACSPWMSLALRRSLRYFDFYRSCLAHLAPKTSSFLPPGLPNKVSTPASGPRMPKSFLVWNC